ncbi:MAG TPA: DUF2383 domain-containing protein [Gemmatimonadaceae bacterium]|nr:DUF2383 domain-containing protein [Gemmatimonadaceae bacterium]
MTPQTARKTEVVRTVNSLLRSEITAADSYLQAIARIDANRSSDIEVLRKIAQEHSQAVQALRAEIERLGGQPAETSGGWLTITKNVQVQGDAQVFLEAATLADLKEGEARGLSEYRDAVRRVNGSTAALIEESLIPAQLEHIDVLSEMIQRL